MLLVPLESLRPGVELARPVLHPERDNLMLLNEGYSLDEHMIRQLEVNGVGHVWIRFPGLEDIAPPVDEEVARGHLELYRALDRSIDTLEQRVQVKVHVGEYRRAVHSMLGRIMDSPEHEVLTHQLRMCGPRLAGHMSNVSYLSLLVAAHLSGYLRDQRRSLPAEVAENTEQLGVGALLHDVGKMNMPDDLREKSVLDEESGWPEYRMHCKAGFEEVREHVSPVAASVVLHHHQRHDGRGFPEVYRSATGESAPLSGSKIHIFARIVACVDVFDRLLCPTGDPVPTIVALSRLRSERFAGWFDPVVLAALARLVPPFMVGSVVRLSDGNQAVVTGNHPEAPCKPLVRVIRPPLGDASAKATNKQLDLRMCRDVRIAEVDGVNVESHLYDGDFEPGAQQQAA